MLIAPSFTRLWGTMFPWMHTWCYWIVPTCSYLEIGKTLQLLDIVICGHPRCYASGTHQLRTCHEWVWLELMWLNGYDKVHVSCFSTFELAVLLRENDLFKLLNDETFEKILDTMESIKFEAGKDIIKQGDSNAEQFFVIQSGSCAVHVTEAGGASKKMLTYAAGQCFGDMALMYSAPRAATVSTLEPTVVWSMKRQHYLILKRKFFEQVCMPKCSATQIIWPISWDAANWPILKCASSPHSPERMQCPQVPGYFPLKVNWKMVA